MDELHSIGVLPEHQEKLEKINPLFVKEGILESQKKSWTVMHEIKNRLTEGMTEKDGRELCLKVFKEFGVTKHWHTPHLRLGPGTTLNFNFPQQTDYRLQKNDPIYFDLGPVWPDLTKNLEYEGDVGDGFVFGENPEATKCIEATRQIFNEAKNKWQKEELTGQSIYVYLRKRAADMGYTFVEKVDGHRIGDFPHHRYTKQNLSGLDFTPSPYLWVLEVQLNHPTLPIGAFYEDILG